MPEKVTIINRIRELNVRMVDALQRNVKQKRDMLKNLPIQ